MRRYATLTVYAVAVRSLSVAEPAAGRANVVLAISRTSSVEPSFLSVFKLSVVSPAFMMHLIFLFIVKSTLTRSEEGVKANCNKIVIKC